MPDQTQKQIRWTPIFERIPEDKRQRVLDCAKKAFSEEGFARANVNRIAEAAGISVGSLYKYFRTKEDLFLAIIETIHEVLVVALDEIFREHAGFYDRIEAITRAAISSSESDPELLRIYIACTTQELMPLASKLSNSIESVAAARYRHLVEDARQTGEIPPGMDADAASFLMDNLFLMLQFSFGSAYYAERLRVFLGEGALEDKERIVLSTLAFIKRALGEGPAKTNRT